MTDTAKENSEKTTKTDDTTEGEVAVAPPSPTPPATYAEILRKSEENAIRIEEANKKTEELLKRNEELAARNLLGGNTDAGTPEKKKEKLTDIEYYDAMTRGEVNPLKEDGII